jgi:superfamily II DNA or RNA helicase
MSYNTFFHTRLFAEELTQNFASDHAEKLAKALVDAQVDLNPHQVDAALFAFQSPLSKGAILADEVGLGKTIEAGLVIAQRWAERKRRVLIITPANLRKQWFQEMKEKFFLPCEILESKSYNILWQQGRHEPFTSDNIVICSYQFARSKAADVRRIAWDLVVIDEAHRLRNVYKPSNVIASTLKKALEHAPKILLTATPLQNNLLELYGLVSVIDDRTFGNLSSFREQFGNLNDATTFKTLRDRLRPICHRTLRRQVQPYIKYTKRYPIVEDFTPHDAEIRLYEMVSEYLQRDNLYALPNSQRNLITLVLRKLLASSTFAIAGALGSIRDRLKDRLGKEALVTENKEGLGDTLALDTLAKDYEALEDTEEEWVEEGETPPPLSDKDREVIKREIADLERFFELASSIDDNAKGQALLIALEKAFGAAERLGAKRKAIIFTESKRTQAYLLRLLESTPHQGKTVLFNGTNSDPGSKRVLKEWLARHQGSDRITGSPTADMRSALVDEFKERAEIMIATEAGAEGINLQFCSLVVNYDLPWNPQRIEQRIGRCHRYGQQHDVVVVNFVNRSNEADQRVFELLEQKFKLFDGVFGSSDEVLGAVESGVDFEKRISDIYQRCRTPAEIQTAFDELQRELSLEITDSLQTTRQKLLEHVDEDVHKLLKMRQETSQQNRSHFEQLLLKLSEAELGDAAKFDNDGFDLLRHPNPEDPTLQHIPLGRYELPRRTDENHLYRLSHPLAQYLIGQAKTRPLETSELEFSYADYGQKITVLENLRGERGWLRLCRFTVSALTQTEDHLLFTVLTDKGDTLDAETARDFFKLPASVLGATSEEAPKELQAAIDQQRSTEQKRINERNAIFFEQEAERLDAWAEDLKVGLERELKDMDRQIKEARRAATSALTLEEKLAGQKQIKTLEASRNQKRRTLFDAQDKIDAERGQLISELEGKLQQHSDLVEVFTIRWSVV